MELLNLRKESSERSDVVNWTKQLLIEQTTFHFDSIEGCNQNNRDVVTHLMERARADMSGSGDFDLNQVMSSIKALEVDDNRLIRKIRFANCFGKNLTYIIYCNENGNVFVFNISGLNEITFQEKYTSFPAFSKWIETIKGWKSTKPYREADLPDFDIALRKAGCAWPTNIDCFISDNNNVPRSILEFQNTRDVAVKEHCNNDWFLCKSIRYNDIRRWTSQEILRVQSGLKFFIITWSTNEKNFIFKRVDRITIPALPFYDRNAVNAYQEALSNFINHNRDQRLFNEIAVKYSSFNFSFNQNQMSKNINRPPLTVEAKTFPFIYYAEKEYFENNPNRLIELGNNFIQ